MKTLITILAITMFFNSEAQASGKGKIFAALRKVTMTSMAERKLIENFNQALFSTRKAALEGLDKGTEEVLLVGKMTDDHSHFAIQMASKLDSSGEVRTTLELSSNTKNSAMFTDMFLTLKLGPAFPRIGKQGERIGVFAVDTRNLGEVNKKLSDFLYKAQNQMFAKEMKLQKMLPYKATN